MKRFIAAFLLLVSLYVGTVPALAAASGETAEPGRPYVQSETAVLMDADTGQILYEKDMDKRMYPASITKVITGMLALQKGNIADSVTISEDAVNTVDMDSANIALSPGEVLTLEQALYAMAVASANDAANGIAEAIGGTIDAFVAMMNTAARDAGAANTHFNNTNGLPDDNHYTTAHDMALITAEALKTQGFTEIFGTKRYKIPPTNNQPETRIVNSSNRFLNGEIEYDGILISKAGWTNDAKHTLVTAAQRDGTTLVVVVMKSNDSTVKWSDTKSLLDYGFEQFTRVTIPKEATLEAAPEMLNVPGMSQTMVAPDTYEVQDVSLLVPTVISPGDVQITYGTPKAEAGAGLAEVPVQYSVPATDPSGVSELLLTTTVKASLQPASSDAVQTRSSTAESKPGIFRIILIALASVVGFLLLAFVVLVVRRAIIIRRRKLRKQRRKQQQIQPQDRHKQAPVQARERPRATR